MDRFVCRPMGPLLSASPQSELPCIVVIQTLEEDADKALHAGHRQSVGPDIAHSLYLRHRQDQQHCGCRVSPGRLQQARSAKPQASSARSEKAAEDVMLAVGLHLPNRAQLPSKEVRPK